jgi:hypothetical protein
VSEAAGKTIRLARLTRADAIFDRFGDYRLIPSLTFHHVNASRPRSENYDFRRRHSERVTTILTLNRVSRGSPMPHNPPTLTRQTLYDLAWSKSMSELAKDFGISDVALAKRCRAVDVPIPYRGYWARKAAGQIPPKLPLPKYRTRTPSPTTAAAQPKPPRKSYATVRRSAAAPYYGKTPPSMPAKHFKLEPSITSGNWQSQHGDRNSYDTIHKRGSNRDNHYDASGDFAWAP